MKSGARNENFVCLNCGAVNGDPSVWLKKINPLDPDVWLEKPADGEQPTVAALSSLFYGPHPEQYARPRAERPFFHYADPYYSTELLLEQYFDPATPKEADILALDVPTLRALKNKRLPSSKFDGRCFCNLVMEILRSGAEAATVIDSTLWQSAPEAWRKAFVNDKPRGRAKRRKS